MTTVAENREVTTKPRALVDVDAVSDRLGLPRSSVYQLAREGRLPGTVRFGRRMKFDIDRLERWLESGGEAGGEK